MPVAVTVDAGLGGRWTSLRSAHGREWLWSRDEPGRASVVPGDAFLDAGGVEECLPTIDGPPDHGDAWSRPWVVDGVAHRVDGDGFGLRRAMSVAGDRLTVDYELRAEPGWRFIWAAHALLALSDQARLELPPGAPATSGVAGGLRSFAWPELDGVDLSRFGPADGTALMVIVPDVGTAEVVDGPDRLRMTVTAPGWPTAVALWRNLGGWPAGSPYRSIGVEPVLGRTGDLAACGPGDAVVVPAAGVVRWRLDVEALRVDPKPGS